MSGGGWEAGSEPPPPLPEIYEAYGPTRRDGLYQVLPVVDLALRRVLVLKTVCPGYVDQGWAMERFLASAQLGGKLEHPCVVPVHRRGQLPDGRPYWTERAARGERYGRVMKGAHRHLRGCAAGPGCDHWSLWRLIAALLKVCETLAFAHERGIGHGALSERSILLGDYGEVLVTQWGGAPASPEERDGLRVAPSEDILALGHLLHVTLHGRPSDGPPPANPEGSPPGRALDQRSFEELQEICQRASAGGGGGAFVSARALAEALRRWLEEANRREEALELARDARAAPSHLAERRARVRALREEASERLAGVMPFDPLDRKLPGWGLEDEAGALEREVDLAELRFLLKLRGALRYQSDLIEIHDQLADYYRDRLEGAETEGDARAARQMAVFLDAHDRRGRHAAFLRGTGALTLHTSPPGARASLFRYAVQRRRLVPVFERDLGETPIRDLPIEMGSYLVKIEAPGHHEVRYPVIIARGERWTGIRPGDTEPYPIWLPPEGALGPDEVYIPAGPFLAGGDPEVPSALPRQRIWVEPLIFQRDPVTMRAYFEFLDALLISGREPEARRHAPSIAGHGTLRKLAPTRRSDGSFAFELPEGAQGALPEALLPASGVEWAGAMAFAEWRSARTGERWSLPGEVEWEKAARGVDGRRFPWGDFADPTWCGNLHSAAGEPRPRALDAFPVDVSPYGVRGMAGNVADWCLDPCDRQPAPLPQGLYPPPEGRVPWRQATGLDEGASSEAEVEAIDAFFRHQEKVVWTDRVFRGGYFEEALLKARAAHRHQTSPWEARPAIGFRLCRRPGEAPKRPAAGE